MCFLVVVSLGWFVDRFSIDFWLILGSKINQKSIRKAIENKMEVGMDFGWLLDWFLVDLGPKLGSKIDQKSIKNRWNEKYWFLEVRGPKILIFHDFWSSRGGGHGRGWTRVGAVGGPEILDPLNDQKSKKITKVTKWLSTKWLRTPLHAMRASAVADMYI